MAVETQTDLLAKQEEGIILALLYFDIFSYPLTEKEIASFQTSQTKDCLTESLRLLQEKEIIFKIDDLYLLQADPSLVKRRKAGNTLAEKKMETAKKFSSVISAFPFVKAVMLSGSISKGYMDEKSDIDYFIITSRGRLWFVRTALALFRRIFLMNSHQHFCTNYFIDETTLEISEKNVFTAVEITTLKPMFGREYVYRFHNANHWCDSYFPNRIVQNGLTTESEPWLKKSMEKLLSAAWFDSLDQKLMNYSIQRWKDHYKNQLESKDFSIAFQSTPQVSRSHPQFYQKKVLDLYRQKINAFEKTHRLKLS